MAEPAELASAVSPRVPRATEPALTDKREAKAR